MNFNRFSLLFPVFALVPTLSRAQYIHVDDTYTAQQLIQNVLIDSPCANASNFTVTGDPFHPGEQSYGYFNASATAFPFTNGIVMSTSRATRTQGPNDNLIDEGDTAWLGDSDLEQALDITNTFNATVLEFDFLPLTSQISFDYIFASEEYQGTAPCQYSDGFAFLLKKANSADPYRNLALIPGTDTPVLVTSVHPEIAGSCAAQNEMYFGGYNGVSDPTNFNGKTVPLTARATVIPGTLYHIKLVIADHENIRYDSAIFLAGGSFAVGADLGPDRLIATQNPICSGTNYPLDATEPQATSYKWYKDGTLLAGENNPLFNVTSAGVYKVEIALGATTCVATGEVKIEYANLPDIIGTTIVQCDPDIDNTTLFNLASADAIVKNGDLGLGEVTYYTSFLNAKNHIDPIQNPNNYQSAPATVFASVPNIYGCYNIAPVQLQISNNSIENFPLLETCDLDSDPVQDGIYHFNLPDADQQVTQGLPAGLIVQYYETYNDALLNLESALPDMYTNIVPNHQTVYAKILNGPDCYGIIPVNLVVNSLAPPNFDDETVIACYGNPATLSVPGGYPSYIWSTGSTGNTTIVQTAGDYSVTVTQNGCTATKNFTVVNPDLPHITFIDVLDLSENGNAILVHYSGNGNYEFSIDGLHFQDSPYFSIVDAGLYTVSMRDKNACGSDSEMATVLYFPKYFTPNGDGFNDYWTIGGLQGQPDAIISIFDRFGKLIYRFKGNGQGWDGKYNSRNLASTDYWFTATLENGKTVKGHFALKR